MDRQAKSRKISTVASVKSKSPSVAIEEVPTETAIVAPVVSKKTGRPAKVQRVETGTSSRVGLLACWGLG